MRKIIAVVLLIIAVILYFFLFAKSTTPKVNTSAAPTATSSPSSTTRISQSVLFVPYWSADTISSGYTTYVYFGVSPTETGNIDTSNDGYAGLPAFVTATQNDQTLLTITLLSNNITQKILENSVYQENLIQDSLQIANAYGFNGIVLDLEYNGLAFPSVTQSVTNFSTRFAKEVKVQNLSFYQTLYGDTFYLDRPYNVSSIAKAADGIFILAYDFHKADGTPGPNFPLTENNDADYSFPLMLADFTKVVPKNKLTIIFGMFGYDWTVDSQNRPEKAAESLTDDNLTSQFLNKCTLKNCILHRNAQTHEPSITYTDSNGQNHLVWFEDMTSVAQKEKVLEETGVSQVGFWANGYF